MRILSFSLALVLVVGIYMAQAVDENALLLYRFKVVYTTEHLTQEEIESVGYEWTYIDEMLAEYNPDKLVDGFNDEGSFYIRSKGRGCGHSVHDLGIDLSKPYFYDTLYSKKTESLH